MLDILFVPVAIVYLLVVGALFGYGIHFFYLTYVAWHRRRFSPSPPPAENWPAVTVQLPIYNELYVAERVIEAAARLDYPPDRLEIQVLDDSTDETVQLVQAAVERWRGRGVDVVHLHRASRPGYKAGALAAGMQQARGEFLAIFDADFLPSPDFLKQTVPYLRDPAIAFVQARWGHVNRRYSFLTYLQSLAIDAHFMIEQFARSQAGLWFNFNGTAGVWRRAAIEDAGGWQAHTLTEDLDLSYRAFLRGWRACYLRHVVAPAELPVSFMAYRRQQHRWARGSLECALSLLPQVWDSPASPAQKLAATLHLTGYGVHLLLFALVLLYPVVLLLTRRYADLISLFGIAAVFNATAFAPTIFFVTAQQQLGRRWWRQLPVILFITILGAGMMLNTVRAALQIFVNQRPTFERTPKFGILHKAQDWTRRRYQLPFDTLILFELALALLNGGTIILAFQAGNPVIAIYAGLFCAGLLFCAGFTLAQLFSLHRRRARSGPAPSKNGRGPHQDNGIELAADGGPPNPPQGGTLVLAKQPPKVRPGGLTSLPHQGVFNPGPGPLALEQAIVRAVAYSDVFDYPLTAEEIHRYLELPASLDDVQEALQRGLVPARLSYASGFYTLPGRQAIVETRRQRAALAAQTWPQARRYGRWIASLPFASMVAVTGSLAVDNVEANTDIDYLIVTRPGRLWLCRALVILLVRLAARRGHVICPNYFISEQALLFQTQNLYTARELVQMVPLAGPDIYRQILRLNTWTADYLPNAGPLLSPRPALQPRFQPLRRLAEAVLSSAWGERLERWEMERKVRKFNRLAGNQAEIDFCRDWCKGHFGGNGQRALAAFSERMQQFDLSPGPPEPVRPYLAEQGGFDGR